MQIRLVTSWRVLMGYAYAVGQARLAFRDAPNAATKAKLEKAIAEHDEYRDLCLEADDMIDFPDFT